MVRFFRRFRGKHLRTLRILPPEIRIVIFELSLEDDFEKRPKTHKFLDFQESYGPVTDSVDEASATLDYRSLHSYWSKKDAEEPLAAPFLTPALLLPTLKEALIPERQPYHDFFSLRIQAYPLNFVLALLRIGFYEVANLSTEWGPEYGCTDFIEPDHSRWKYLQDFMDDGQDLKMLVDQDLPSQDGCVLEYPEVASMAPLMLTSVRNIQVRLKCAFFLSKINATSLISYTAQVL